VPDLQREFVWGKQEIRSLLASVLAGLPIGSLLLADSLGSVGLPSVTGTVQPRIPANGGDDSTGALPRHQGNYLILDGRQRLTALCLGFRRFRRGPQPNDGLARPIWYLKLGHLIGDGEPTDAIDDPLAVERALDCGRGGAGVATTATQMGEWLRAAEARLAADLEHGDPSRVGELRVPLPCLLVGEHEQSEGPSWTVAARRYLKLVDEATRVLAAKTGLVEQIRSRLANTVIPVQVLAAASPAVRKMVFERLNTTGILLTAQQLKFMRYELRPDFDRLGKGDSVLAGRSHSQLFEVVCSMGNPKQDLSELVTEEDAKVVRQRIAALLDTRVQRRVWKLMQDEWGLSCLGDAPCETTTQAAIVVATELLSDSHDRNRLDSGVIRAGLSAWWWQESARRVEVGGRSAATRTLVTELRKWVDDEFTGWNLQIDRSAATCLCSPRLATGRAAALLACLLRTQKLPDLETGEPFNPSADMEEESHWDLHHIFPKARLREVLPGDAAQRRDLCANLTLTRERTNRAILRDNWPSDVWIEMSGAGQTAPGVDRTELLKRHGIDLDAYRGNEFDKHIASRDEWLHGQLLDRLSIG